jgi:beta-lactam-binding protein with PASTA domain
MKQKKDNGVNLNPFPNGPTGGGSVRTVILFSVIIVVLAVIVALIVFFLSLKGAEQIKVPDVESMPLETAIIELQERALNARVQLHFSSDPEDKGTILGQEPEPGAVVKAGSNVVLRVSRGAVIDRVEDYLGWTLEDLEIHLQTLFTTYGPLLRIKQPVVKVFDESEPGTILEQKPEPGTRITGMTDLELIVSKGPKEEQELVDKYVGLDFREAVEKLIERDIPFAFSLLSDAEAEESAESGDAEQDGEDTGPTVAEVPAEPGIVVAQTPSPGETVEQRTLRELVMVHPEDLPEDHVFGILKRKLPDYPVLVDLTLEAISVEGKRKEILTMKHPGGIVAIPYVEKEGTLLILSVFDQELIRYTVRPEREEEAQE